MSAIRMLFRVGISAIVVAGVTGCQHETVEPVSFDSMRNDISIVDTSESTILEKPPSGVYASEHWMGVPDQPDDSQMTLSENISLISQDVERDSTYWRETLAGSIWEKTPAFGQYIHEYKQINEDVIGWLYVPGTNINDPIVQNPVENNYFRLENDYYLNHDFYGNPDKNGTYCADYRASFGAGGRSALSQITALYGHSWDDDPNGTLFSQLKQYREPVFAKEHPYIFFSTESEDMAWEVFAVFDTTTSLPYVLPKLSGSKYYQTMDMVNELTYYNYDIAVGDNQKILVLSTCTFSVDGHPSLPAVNDYRFVVMARLASPAAEYKEEAVFSINTTRLVPDATRAYGRL